MDMVVSVKEQRPRARSSKDVLMFTIRVAKFMFVYTYTFICSD